MAAATLSSPTEEQLRLALRHLWRPGRPQTLEAALEHPTFGHCVRGLARNLGRSACRPEPPAATPRPGPKPPAHWRPWAGPDIKRLAANDRDDD